MHRRAPSKPDIVLGQKFARLRKQINMTQVQLGGKINETWQQVDKFEKGAFISAPMIERIAESMGLRIPKRTIRRIVNARKLEIEEEIPQEQELIELYNEAFADVFDDEDEETEEE